MPSRKFHHPLRPRTDRRSVRGPFWSPGVWAVAVAAVLTASVSAVPGSFALWNDSDAVDAGTITSGRLDAAIAAGATIPITDTSAALGTLTDLIPGESRGVSFTVRNTGNVPTVISAARSAATNQYLILDLSTGMCAAPPAAGVLLTSTPVNVSSAVAPETNIMFCLRVTLDESAPAALQGAAVGPYGIDLTAGLRP